MKKNFCNWIICCLAGAVLCNPGYSQVTSAPASRPADSLLRWVDSDSQVVLFTVRDIVRFDWDRQVFELTRDRAMDLMSRPLRLRSGFSVRGAAGEIYSGCFMSAYSSMSYDGPTICDQPAIGIVPPLYRIEGGYPGGKGERDIVRFDPRLHKALEDAGVLKKIDDTDDVDPIEQKFVGWYEDEKKENKVSMTLFPETIRIGRTMRVTMRFAPAMQKTLRADRVEMCVTLRNEADYNGRPAESRHVVKMPVSVLATANGSFQNVYPYRGLLGTSVGDLVVRPGRAQLSATITAFVKTTEGEKTVATWTIPPHPVEILPEKDEAYDTFTQVYDHCYFYDGGDGHVWLRTPFVALGKTGVMATPPVRLSRRLARKYESLRSRPKSVPADRDYWEMHLPTVAKDAGPLILVRMEATWRQVRSVLPKNATTRSARMLGDEYDLEVVSARLLHVEYLSAEWLTAWHGLDGVLKEIGDLSRAAPATDPKAKLIQAVEQGRQYLGGMLQPAGEQEPQQELKARLVTVYRRQKVAEWGGKLRQYADRFGIAPAVPWPPLPARCDGVGMLIASTSPADLIAKIEASCSRDALDDPLVSSLVLGYRSDTKTWGRITIARPFAAWEVAQLNAEQFQALQAEARDYRQRSGAATRPAAETQPAGM